jgi:CubicO group peptidase (beta-lactamase class C family)
VKYSSQEAKIAEKLKNSIVDVTPGVSVRAYHLGRLVCDVSVGHTYPYYDLASLTKVIFTQQAIMEAFDKGLWNFETQVRDLLPDFKPQILIKDLLTHTSGLEWWRPFYQSVPLELSWPEKRRWLYQEINNSVVKKNGQAVYSDLGFMLLGFVLEKIHQQDLLSIWQSVKERYYPSTSFDFHVNNKTDKSQDLFAPTEDCPWRQRIMRAEVHDENTWSLGGVSTHAGLFGSIEDVSAFGLNVRSQLQGIARYSIRQKTAQLFATRAIPAESGDWALGYMMPSVEGASCGPHFSVLSIGHTGFTGTSFWYDPRHDLLVLVLSNRVHYGRENRAFVGLRPQIHSWIYESLRRTV